MTATEVSGAFEIADSRSGVFVRDSGYFGKAYAIVFPWSEAAMHCRLADHPAAVVVDENGVYLLNRDGSRGPHFTHGEAGVFVGCQPDGADFVCTRWGAFVDLV